MKKLIGLTLMCLLVHAISFAGNYTWTGTINSSWDSTGNWNSSVVPTSSDTITINSTSNSLVLDGNRTVRRIVINSDTLDLGGDTLTITVSAGMNGGTINNGVFNAQSSELLNFSGTTFNAVVIAKGRIKLNGCVFNTTASFEHNNSTDGTGSGGNTFNGVTTLKNSGTTAFRLAGANPDIFNNDVTIINVSSAGNLQLSYGATTYFNGNIEVSASTSTISFSGSGDGSSILDTGKTITIGSAGVAGTLLLRNFTQLSNTAQSLSLSGTLNLINSTFIGAFTCSASGVLLSTCNFYGTSNFTKTGTTSNYSAGGNHFFESATINNNATNSAILRFATTSGDIYHSDVALNTNTGFIQLAYSDTNEFKGNITINSSKVTFNNGNGIVQCTGGNAQEFGGSAAFVVGKLWMNKSTSTLTLQKAVTIDSLLTLTSGIVYTDSTNLLTLKAGGVATGASDLSYIDGPMKKIGNTAFEFPVGKESKLRSMSISAGGLITDVFRCQFIIGAHPFGSDIDSTLLSINDCDYWRLERLNGSTSPIITLSWGEKSCFIAAPFRMKVAYWNGSIWKDGGNGGTTGDSFSGSIISDSTISYEYFKLGNEQDTIQIPTLSNLASVALFSLNDSLSALNILHVSGDVVGKTVTNVVGFNTIEEQDSLFALLEIEFKTNYQLLNGQNYYENIVSDGDTITTSGFYKLSNDSIHIGLTIYGDSTTNIVIRTNPKVVFLDSSNINLIGALRKNITWVCNDVSFTMQSEIYGTFYSKSVTLDSGMLGAIQVMSLNHISLNDLNSNNQRIYLKSQIHLSEDLRSSYFNFNTLTLPCNKLYNGDLEFGVIPIGTGGILSNNANNWDATRWQFSGFCSSTGGGNNTPDLFDMAVANSQFLSCTNGQVGGLGIPTNFVSNGIVNVRSSGSRYFHTIDNEVANVRFAPNSLTPKIYLLEFFHAFSNCNTPAANSSVPLCIGLLPNIPGAAVTPDILSTTQLNTWNWQGTPVAAGNWIQNLQCIDLSGYTLNSLNNFDRIGFKPELNGVTTPRDVFFDDFQLVEVADAGPDQLICGGEPVSIGDIDNCHSLITGVQIDYQWTSTPSYSWATGQQTLPSSMVNPSVTTTFTLAVTITYPDGITTCTDIDEVLVVVSSTPNAFTITGSNTVCTPTPFYSISPVQSGITYSWSFLPAFSTAGSTVSFSPTTGATTTATFSSLTSDYMLQVIGMDIYGCFMEVNYPVNRCCQQENEALLIDQFTVNISTFPNPSRIEGVLIVNSNLTLNGNDILMGNGAEIRVVPGFTLSLNNVFIHPCETFWKSITVMNGAMINVNGSTIQGGQYAVDILNGGGYNITGGSFFYDNYVALRVTGSSSGGSPRIIENSFIGVASSPGSLYNQLDDFIGQQPPTRNQVPCTARPFAGIQLNFAGTSRIGSTLANRRLFISDAMYGIHSYNTFLRVVQTVIEDIQYDICQPYDFNFASNGAGIFSNVGWHTGALWVTDNNGGSAFENEFKNCVFGIRTNRLSPIVRKNGFTDVVDGIRSSNVPSFWFNNRMEISENYFEFGRLGTRVLNSPADFRADFNGNIFVETGVLGPFSGYRGAINVIGNRFIGCEVDVNNNTIDLTLLRQGILAMGTSITNIGHNEIELKGASWQRGILLSGCDDVSVIKNNITGASGTLPASRIGIHSSSCGIINKLSNLYQCNHVISCARDIEFETAILNVDFDRNIMESGGTGLRLTGAILGNQNDKFNKWCSNFTTASVDADQGSVAAFRIPPAPPQAPPSNCEYDPFVGGVIGTGLVTVNVSGSDDDPGCPGNAIADTIYVTDYDSYIVDSLEQSELPAGIKYQYRRLLAGKLAAHPYLLESDSSINAFWNDNQYSDEIGLAVVDDLIRNIYSEGASYFDAASDVNDLITFNNDTLAFMDSILHTGLSSIDSLENLRRREEITIMNDSLVSVLDSLVDAGYLLLKNRADELSSTIQDLSIQSEQGLLERDYHLFVLKYGPWSNATISATDTLLISNMAQLCMKEYGIAVAWARKWYGEWYEELLEDDSLCNNNSRISMASLLPEKNGTVTVYPNPNTGIANINIVGISDFNTKTVRVNLYEAEGSLLISNRITSSLSKISLQHLRPGVYIVEIGMDEMKIHRSKLILIK